MVIVVKAGCCRCEMQSAPMVAYCDLVFLTCLYRYRCAAAAVAAGARCLVLGAAVAHLADAGRLIDKMASI